MSVVKRYIYDPTNKTNVEIVSEIYNVLKKSYRNEYYYKNTLLNKLLIGIHSINTTTALTEVSIAKSKADFVMINGKAVVYEIKTELDNFDRLENQINDYYKSFNHVAVVTCNESLESLERKIELIAKPVGIYILQRNGKIKTVKSPEAYNECINAEVMFRILRKYEYEEILKKRFGRLPEVTQFRYYKECKNLFLKLSVEDAYDEFIRQLKKRNYILKEEFKKIPYELKFLAYFMELKEQDYVQLAMFLNKRFGGV